MFDGSHRSRRTIDLSAGGRQRRQRRKTATATATALTNSASESNRTSVLEEARIQRNERRQVQLRHSSAKTVQRIFRGQQARKHLAEQLATADISDTVVSVRLSKPLAPFLAAGVSQVLEDYYNALVSTAVSSQCCLCSFSSTRIFETALSEVRPNRSPALLPLVVHMLQHKRGNLALDSFISLIDCDQEWLSSSNAKHSSTAGTLWHWSCRMAATFEQRKRTAVMVLLASTLFCARSNSDESLQRGLDEVAADIFPVGTEKSLQAYQRALLPYLVAALTGTSEIGERVEETIHKAIRGRECTVLQNVLDMWKKGNRHQFTPNMFMSLVDMVLSKRPELTLLVSLVVQGENIEELLFKKQYTSSTASLSYGDDRVETEEDDDEDDDVEMQDLSGSNLKTEPGVKKARRQRSSTLTRRDLQTVPKLDRLYHDVTIKSRKQVLANIENAPNKEQFVQLATQLGNADIWIEWGNIIFDRNCKFDGSKVDEAKETYVNLLFSLLQCTTGLRTTKSPFLTQIAFHRGLRILEGLWQSLVGWMTGKQDRQLLVTAGMGVFCDIFAHHLLVLHDEEFLLYYTASDSSVHTKRVILAEDVIARLGSALYDVYWTRPVLAADVQLGHDISENAEEFMKLCRGRLLLSGTKLWNSLYERWCRLVRHAPTFGDESVWWFPSLMSREGDGLVTLRQAGVPDENDDGSTMSMDVDEDESDGDDAGPSPADAQSDALAEIFRDPKMARILTCIPQVLPFERRVKMFSSLLSVDKSTTQNEEAEFRRALMMMTRGDAENENVDFGGRERVEIRRAALYEDSMDQLNELGSKLKRTVQVTFINQHGATEAGIDGGGVFKEFLDDLIKEAFDPGDVNRPSRGAPQLFSVTPLQTLAVNSSESFDLSHYEFLGRVLGKAVYESILVEPQFCLPFLNQLLGKRNSLDDLKNFDLEYYSNLIKLRNLSATEIDGLGLTFELTTTSTGSRDSKGAVTKELIPGGSSMPVTKENVIQYVHLVAHRRLNVDGASQTKSFLKGFRDLIPASWLRLFSSNELQKLISGDDTVRGIDVRSMKAAMRYSGGYHPSQPIIGWFWEVVEEMTPEQQRKFLRFMTSCSRQPLLGFQALEPLPCIQQLRLGEGLLEMNNYDMEALSKVTPLPTSSTCMNLLKLPNYMNKQLLKKKLLDAIESGAGFELT